MCTPHSDSEYWSTPAALLTIITMRTLIVLSAVLAVSLAAPGYTPGVYGGYAGAPQITSQGVPVETPEVQAAKASHLAALARAGGAPANPTHSQYAAPAYPAPPAYTAPSSYYVPSSYPAQQPAFQAGVAPGPVQDTPEVAAAKAAHFSAYSQLAAAAAAAPDNGPSAYAYNNYAAPAQAGPYGYAAPQQPQLGAVQITAQGVPVETPEVQAARAADAAAHAAAKAGYLG